MRKIDKNALKLKRENMRQRQKGKQKEMRRECQQRRTRRRRMRSGNFVGVPSTSVWKWRLKRKTKAAFQRHFSGISAAFAPVFPRRNHLILSSQISFVEMKNFRSLFESLVIRSSSAANLQFSCSVVKQLFRCQMVVLW